MGRPRRLHPVASSNLHAIGYDQRDKQLWIEFNNQSLYKYDDVPKEVWDGLVSADSKGVFFHKEIRPRFGGKLVRPAAV